MTLPANVAAIDAGSNAIRLLIARVHSPSQIEKVESERVPVRLGHNVFVRHEFDKATLRKALSAFRQFQNLLDKHKVERHRAVATSACREARNRDALIGNIHQETGILLEVIDGMEEARLIRSGVLHALGDDLSPRLIMDLGGGSLELNFLDRKMESSVLTLPLGTVRFMETLGIRGAVSKQDLNRLRGRILSTLQSHIPKQPNLSGAITVACGGNAEALALLAPGEPIKGIATMDVYVLEELLWDILRVSVDKRMKAFRVRKDRAEVMGIAAVVYTTVGHWMNLSRVLVPGVGVREGVIQDLVGMLAGKEDRGVDSQTRALLQAARIFAARCESDPNHVEQVRRLSIALFEQLQPLHKMGPVERQTLELGALLHDVGHFVGDEGHQKHGEYLVLHGAIPGLEGRLRGRVASLVRYHSRFEPDADNPIYVSFDHDEQRQIRLLAAILRVADSLDFDHRQNVLGVKADVQKEKLRLQITVRNGQEFKTEKVQSKAQMLEKEFGVEATFKVQSGS